MLVVAGLLVSCGVSEQLKADDDARNGRVSTEDAVSDVETGSDLVLDSGDTDQSVDDIVAPPGDVAGSADVVDMVEADADAADAPDEAGDAGPDLASSNQSPVVTDLAVESARPGTLSVEFTVADVEGDDAHLAIEFAVDGDEFLPCTLHASVTDDLVEPTAEGVSVTLEWLAQVDLGKGTTKDVVVRVRADDEFHAGKAAQTEPFDFAGPAFGLTDVSGDRLPELTGDTRGVAMADLDGDFDGDLVVSRAGTTNLLLRQGADGAFLSEELPGGSFDSQPVAVLDLDGDLDLDLFVPNVNAPSRVLANDGTGTFTDVTLQWLGEDFVYQIERAVVGDVDGDLRPDIILLCSGSQQERLLLNTGSAFQDASGTNLPADSLMAAGGSLGSIDNVGGPDLVFNNFISNQGLQLWTNEGGVFTDGSDRIKSPYDAMGFDALLVDMNLDGYQDIVELNMMNLQRVLLNDESGNFLAMPAAFPSDIGPWGDGVIMAVDGESGDLNLDGIADVVVACGGITPGNNHNEFFLGSGSGGVIGTDVGFPDDGGDTRHVQLFDVDFDGDLDVFFANSLSQSRLYIND